MPEVTLPRPLINQLLAHAQHSPEEEVCGLVSRAGEEAFRVYPVANVAAEADHLFAMDPQQQIDAMRQMREGGGGTVRHLSLPPSCTARAVAA